MNILVDLIELVFIPGAGPETPRGWLVVSLIYGLLVTGSLIYALLDSSSECGTAIILALVGAPLGTLLSTLHAIREPRDRWLATCTIIANAAAVILALAVLA